MKLKSRLITLACSLGIATLMSSCQSTGGATAGSDAVTCDKCKTVWVKTATQGAGGKGYTTYTTQKSMACPDCESAVANFFKSGEFKHTCSHCGGAMAHCTQH